MKTTTTIGTYDRMSLEDYLLLLHSHSHLHLTVPHLNQIIKMHGYKKIHKVHKKLLTDAVSTLTLVDPTRSTLKEYISPLVISTLDDVVSDLHDLNWQECCVTSFQTLSSWKATHSSPPPHDGVSTHPPKKLKPKRKRNASPGDGGGGANAALDCVSYGFC